MMILEMLLRLLTFGHQEDRRQLTLRRTSERPPFTDDRAKAQRRKGAKVGGGGILWGVALLFCLLSTGFAADPGPLPAPPAARAFADSPMVLSLDVATHWNGRESAVLKKLAKTHPVILVYWTKDLESLLGMTAGQIESVAAVGQNFESLSLLVTGTAALDRDKIAARQAPGAEEQTIHGKSFFAAEKSESGVCFLDAAHMLLGPRRAVQYAVDNWKPRSAKLQWGPPLLFVRCEGAKIRDGMKAVPQAEPYRPLLAAKEFRLTAHVDRDLRIVLQGRYADEEAAAKAVPIYKKMLLDLDAYLVLAEKNMPAFLTNQEDTYPGSKELAGMMTLAIGKGREGVQSATYSQRGEYVEATVSVRSTAPVGTAMLLLSLLPRPSK